MDVVMFGDFSTADHEGVYMVAEGLPGLPAVDVAEVATPGRDGSMFAAATLGAASWSFEVVIRQNTLQAVLDAAAVLNAALHSAKGLQDLAVSWLPGWAWRAVCTGGVQWDRRGWRTRGTAYELVGQVAFHCPNPYARAVPDESWAWTTGFAALASGATVTRVKGNVPSLPVVEIAGVFGSGASIAVTIGGETVTIAGPLASGQVLRLDWQEMDFGIWNGATKQASVVGRMSSFERLALPAGPSTFKVALSAGSLTRVDLIANSRRI